MLDPRIDNAFRALRKVLLRCHTGARLLCIAAIVNNDDGTSEIHLIQHPKANVADVIACLKAGISRIESVRPDGDIIFKGDL